MEAFTSSPLSLKDAVSRVIAEMDTPVSRGELVRRVLALHPSQARRPEDLVIAQVRQSTGLVRLDEGAYAPRGWVLWGSRFRYVPTSPELTTGTISLFPCFAPYLALDTQQQDVSLTLLDDEDGTALNPTALVDRHDGVDLRSWLTAKKFAPGDSLLFTIEDSQTPVFRVRPEAAAQADRAAIGIQDATLEAILVDLIDRDPSDQPFLEEIIPAALARMHEAAREYPGNHWHHVARQSPRLRPVDDYAIARSTFRRPIDRLLGYSSTAAAQRNLEGRILTFNADADRTLRSLGIQSLALPAPTVVRGRDEALHRSTRQIASFLATQAGPPEDAYRCLAVPSIYLAKHEGASLADADFEMLARFLLSYYPRRVLFKSKALTGRLLATLRHFYAALLQSGAGGRVQPHHLSRLHNLVDRKIALYAELDMDDPRATRLFGLLFPNVDLDDAEWLTIDRPAEILVTD